MMTEGHTERQQFTDEETAQRYAENWIRQVRKKEPKVYCDKKGWWVEWVV